MAGIDGNRHQSPHCHFRLAYRSGGRLCLPADATGLGLVADIRSRHQACGSGSHVHCPGLCVAGRFFAPYATRTGYGLGIFRHEVIRPEDLIERRAWNSAVSGSDKRPVCPHVRQFLVVLRRRGGDTLRYQLPGPTPAPPVAGMGQGPVHRQYGFGARAGVILPANPDIQPVREYAGSAMGQLYRHPSYPRRLPAVVHPGGMAVGACPDVAASPLVDTEFVHAMGIPVALRRPSRTDDHDRRQRRHPDPASAPWNYTQVAGTDLAYPIVLSSQTGAVIR